MPLDPIFLYLKTLRKLRAFYATARHRGYLRSDQLVRLFGLFLISLLFFSFNNVSSVAQNTPKPTPSLLESINNASPPTFIPGSPPKPDIYAQSVFIIDVPSGKVLFAKDENGRRFPASTTKIAAALAVRDLYGLDDVLSIPSSCVGRKGESVMGLREGEKISVRNLLYGMLVASASDAACAFEELNPDFINVMNTKIWELGLKDTNFTNAVGLDQEDHYSSAYDLTFLGIELMKNEFLRSVVSTREINLPSFDGSRWHLLKTTDELLYSIPEIKGVKTGFTKAAGGVFVFFFERGQMRVAGTVMGSEDRFGDTRKVLDWVLRSFIF